MNKTRKIGVYLVDKEQTQLKKEIEQSSDKLTYLLRKMNQLDFLVEDVRRMQKKEQELIEEEYSLFRKTEHGISLHRNLVQVEEGRRHVQQRLKRVIRKSEEAYTNEKRRNVQLQDDLHLKRTEVN